MKEKNVKYEKHYSECRCKGENKNCRFCQGSGKFHQGYYLITNGIAFYVDTFK